ncbi:MAG: protein phosphatase 2C domain-containing protein [Planctomycetia bacterium]|nr:protein phosphatase 2C domain-containing protein [Planctomycetia bacterium]
MLASTPDAELLQPFAHGATDRGLVRSGNEDQFLIAVLRKSMQIQQCSFSAPTTRVAHEAGHLWLVADGMGGHEGGETASLLATEAIEEFALNVLKWFFHLRGAEGSELLLEFEQALRSADQRLVHEAAHDPTLFGMGTTVTVAFFLASTAFVLHVGDSRCYLLKRGVLSQVTRDHTLRELLAGRGELPPDEATQARMSHILTNVVGGPSAGIHVDIHKVKVEPGDQLLLCTDGLTAMLTDAEITDVLLAAVSSETACRALIEAANRGGGHDNATAIVARFESVEKAAL